MRNKLIFRADGNADIGLGHLYRLLGFHSLISQMDHYFITRKSSLIHFFPNDIEILFCPESIEKEIEWIKEVFPASESIIVADGYHFDFKYQSELKSLGYKLIIIDDFIQEKYASNVILNPAPISATMDFKGIEVFGIDHALLRTEFIEISKLKLNSM